jgi:AcrR family transcriptional regulator
MDGSSFGTSRGGRSAGSAGAVWVRDATTRPRRAPALSRKRIVDAAVALLDENGVDRLTMRRLAERLEVTSTALYWHVKTKDDVLDLAVDHIFGEVRLPAPGRDWQDDARTLIRRWRAAMLRHPWSPSLIGRPMLGPNVLARTEFLQATLVRGGFRALELTVATRMLANYVIGAALTEATWHQAQASVAQSHARRHISENRARYPTLDESGHLDDRLWDDDDLFERGLDALLDGLSRQR